MTGDQTAIVAAARACIGARFRPRGRSVATGLDCVGLAGIALAGRARTGRMPGGYALRGGDVAAMRAGIAACGLLAIESEPEPGDLLLLAAGPRQYHLAIRTDRGFVHADAGLRRVVEVPGAPAWPLLGAWRAAPLEQEG